MLFTLDEQKQNIFSSIKWNSDGLVPAIVQDIKSGDVLMMAWMNQKTLELTLVEKRTVFWSRSRKCIWRKGESSGHVQTVHQLYVDCDKDCILIKVDQKGVACHTGKSSCFFYEL